MADTMPPRMPSRVGLNYGNSSDRSPRTRSLQPLILDVSVVSAFGEQGLLLPVLFLIPPTFELRAQRQTCGVRHDSMILVVAQVLAFLPKSNQASRECLR